MPKVFGEPVRPRDSRQVSRDSSRRFRRVVGREEIAEHVWDERYDPFSNVIDVYVNRLRKKVGSQLIVTRCSEGYMLRP